MNSAVPRAFDVESFYATLWLGSLIRATTPTFDPYPDELDEVAIQFFSLFKPVAKA